MLDLLLIPAFALLALALRAVRRGDHRTHGHLMVSAFTVVVIRMLLRPLALQPKPFAILVAVLSLAGITMVLGRLALGWREGRNQRQHLPKAHRGFGLLTLAFSCASAVAWLLRARLR
jgi:uncharacterized membrane protein YozB (DUF420 family)